MKCKTCGTTIYLSQEKRDYIRWFMDKYFYIRQSDLAKLLGISQVRVSEIVRGDKTRGGE